QSLYPYQQSPKRLFYLSRAKVNSRSVTNEPELIGCLEKYGFEILFSEDYTLEQQASIFGEARILMCPHGSGLANLVFCPEGAHIIEIYPEGFPYTLYMFMGLNLNLNYHMIGSEPPVPPVTPAMNIERPDFRVNIPAIEEVLDKILNS
ncbi:MAG: glycosyltransferase family 61 protein, partial [Cyanobacteria bacterium]|nr:glycosyltransferase family 61 protein [Cyanobacteriota bacterium]